MFLDSPLSKKQRPVVQANVELLLDRVNWAVKVERFEEAIASLKDDEIKKAKRAEYEIHFDQYDFGNGDKDFSSYHFPCAVSFWRTKFGKGDIDFSGAKFREGIANFMAAEFGDGVVTFVGAKFGQGGAFFRGTEFGEGNVYFIDVEFAKGDVSFDDAKFGKGVATFSNAKFGEGNVSFSNVDMKSTTVYAIGMVVEGNIYFNAIHFKIASFLRLKVSGTASFDDSKFDFVPDFRDTVFERPPEVAEMIVPEPAMIPKEKWWHLSRAMHRDDVAKYRKLKAMALAANDHEKDGEFFAYEMMAKRGYETKSFGGLLFSTIYWVLSDYGQSFMRPLKAMVASLVGFFVGYVAILLSYISSMTVWWDALKFSAIHSFQNAVPIFGTFFRFAAKPEGKSGFYAETYAKLTTDNGAFEWLYWGGVIQSIFGAVLLFLFLLALRNKFRLK